MKKHKLSYNMRTAVLYALQEAESKDPEKHANGVRVLEALKHGCDPVVAMEWLEYYGHMYVRRRMLPLPFPTREPQPPEEPLF